MFKSFKNTPIIDFSYHHHISLIMSIGRLSFANLVLVLLLLKSCKAQSQLPYCPPSSCGHLRNISSPFRLKTDPKLCGYSGYELECENNTNPILYLKSKKYYVNSISYENYSIRVVDPGIVNNHYPSFQLNYDDIPTEYQSFYGGFAADWLTPLNTPVMFVSCLNRVESSLYADAASCNKRMGNSSSLQEYSYVLAGNGLTVADLDDSCRIDIVAWVSSGFPIIDNTSCLSILDMLANGFSLHWYRIHCEECVAGSGHCYLDDKNVVRCRRSCFTATGTGLSQSYSCSSGVSFQLAYGVIQLLIGVWISIRFLCGIPCLFILLHYKYKGLHFTVRDTLEDFLQGQSNLVPIRYKYRDIRKMTKNFKEKLGEGGYGSVYKGKLQSGILVAVKMMKVSNATGQEFISEVATIGRIHHVNVVRLIGFCVEGSKRALVYEFMPCGSLDKYIFSQEEGTSASLSYEKMFEISLGVARGIDYIHRGCEMQILHFDIKPHNILLDQNFTPKISDFGLAKLYPTSNSIVTMTAARGTIGYMAPELFYKNIGGVSYKADVYSYGMLLMEMVGKRKNLNPFAENVSQTYFPSWVYQQFSEGKEIGTGNISEEEREMVKKMIIVALWCIQMNPVDRPSMNTLIELLEGDDEHLQIPPKPFLYPDESYAEDYETQAYQNEHLEMPPTPSLCPPEGTSGENYEIHANYNELPLLSGNHMDSITYDDE